MEQSSGLQPQEIFNFVEYLVLILAAATVAVAAICAVAVTRPGALELARTLIAHLKED